MRKLALLLLFPIFACAQVCNTAVYPSLVAGASQMLVAADNVQTTNSSAQNPTDTVLVVASNSGWLVDMVATIGTVTAGVSGGYEQELVTGIAGNVLTVTRAYAGTTAGTWPQGSTVGAAVDACFHQRAAAEIEAIEGALGANLTNIAAYSTLAASLYNFTPQSPGTSLIVGNTSVTFTPVPKGMNGTDSLHSVWVSGGGGTGSGGEACLITGGLGTSGQSTGAIILDCGYTHTGAYTIQSISGGLQEAVCSVPSTGGDVLITGGSTLTLLANVTTCGKTYARVVRDTGAVVSGAYTIMGASASQLSQIQYWHTSPNWLTIATLWNGSQFDIGGYPDTRQFAFTTGPAVQALVGSINVTSGNGNTVGLNSGVSGYARTTQQSQMAVALYGYAECAAALTSCWSGNTTITNGTSAIGGSNLTGWEFDTQNSASGAGAPALINAISIVSNHVANATGLTTGIQIQRVPGTYQYGNAIYLHDGASAIALNIGAVSESAASLASQRIQMTSYNGSSVAQTANVFLGATNILWLQAGSSTAGTIALDAGGAGTAGFTVGTTQITEALPLQNKVYAYANLPGTPTAGMSVYCSNCTTAATCTTTGSGHMAVGNGSAWSCQ